MSVLVWSVATINDDFTDEVSSVNDVESDVKGLQETKRTWLRRIVSRVWGVHQNRTTQAKAGCAVVWRRARARAVYRETVLGTRPRGARMLARYLAVVLLEFKAPGDPRVLHIAGHAPPLRYAFLWPFWDAALVRRVKRARHPVVVMLDGNRLRRRMNRLAARCGLVWYGIGIDGLMVSPQILVDNLHRLPKGKSDHHPVKGTLTLVVR